jgi:hypothetical protein
MSSKNRTAEANISRYPELGPRLVLSKKEERRAPAIGISHCQYPGLASLGSPRHLVLFA